MTQPNPRELKARQRVFDLIARTLPVLGRDFTVDINMRSVDGDDVGLAVVINPKTAIGRAIVPFIQRDLMAIVEQENQNAVPRRRPATGATGPGPTSTNSARTIL